MEPMMECISDETKLQVSVTVHRSFILIILDSRDRRFDSHPVAQELHFLKLV